MQHSSVRRAVDSHGRRERKRIGTTSSSVYRLSRQLAHAQGGDRDWRAGAFLAPERGGLPESIWASYAAICVCEDELLLKRPLHHLPPIAPYHRTPSKPVHSSPSSPHTHPPPTTHSTSPPCRDETLDIPLSHLFRRQPTACALYRCTSPTNYIRFPPRDPQRPIRPTSETSTPSVIRRLSPNLLPLASRPLLLLVPFLLLTIPARWTPTKSLSDT